MTSYLVAFLFLLSACTPSSFKASSSSPAKKSNSPAPRPSASPYPTPYVPSITPTSSFPPPQPSIPPPPPGPPIYPDCGQCLTRAKQISPQLGFAVNLANTTNCGPYKVAPQLNLCDIHFLSKPGLDIADHEGNDSILKDQFVLYCPCNCGWGIPDCGGFD